jgi:hypothetical protein
VLYFTRILKEERKQLSAQRFVCAHTDLVNHVTRVPSHCLRFIVTNGQPKPILPYKDVLSIRIVLARRIKYRVGRCRVKKYKEEKGLGIQCTLSITIVEAPRITIKGDADIK